MFSVTRYRLIIQCIHELVQGRVYFRERILFHGNNLTGSVRGSLGQINGISRKLTLVVAYLATKRQRQPLYDLVAAWQRCPAKSLFETRNLQARGMATATDVGQVSSLYLMSEEFLVMAKSELKELRILTKGEDQIQRRYLLSWPCAGVNVQASLVERRSRLPQEAWICSVIRMHDQGGQERHS